MYQQDVKGKKLSPLAGIGMIALILLSIAAAGFLERILYQMTQNSIGAIVVWCLIGAEILWMLRMSVREYRYTLTDGRLFIESRYGDNVRLMHEIPLSAVRAVGAQEEIFQKYGNAQAYDKVFTRGYDVPLSTIVYVRNGENKLLSFQPDETMLSMIREHIDSDGEAAAPQDGE